MKPRLAEQQREHMVTTQLADRGIRSEAVLLAMRTVPREAFVEPGDEAHAYDDTRPSAQRQPLSQPYLVALMAEAAELTPRDAVLEVGTGSGYAAAVLSRLAARVIAVERNATLAGTARRGSGWRRWATATWTSSSATERRAGPPAGASTPSSSPPAGPRCRRR
jgi:protein-L-isoaspartate(D-aspartate) O-methyltransferase